MVNSLEDWLNQLLERPIDEIDFLSADDDVARQEIDLLPLPKTRGYTVHASHVSLSVLYRLHDKLREQPCEMAVWNAVLWFLAHPLPISVAHDLIDRGVSVVAMAITRQVDEVQWRMATLFEDALYTLIRERYIEPRYSVAQFETMLQLYTMRNEGVLYMLSFYETPSTEKRAIFMDAVASAEAETTRIEALETAG